MVFGKKRKLAVYIFYTYVIYQGTVSIRSTGVFIFTDQKNVMAPVNCFVFNLATACKLLKIATPKISEPKAGAKFSMDEEKTADQWAL
jgi:hypothetical protein